MEQDLVELEEDERTSSMPMNGRPPATSEFLDIRKYVEREMALVKKQLAELTENGMYIILRSLCEYQIRSYK